METVAQGGTWSDTIGPIYDMSGAVVTNGVSAGHLTVEQFVDSADADKSSGVTLTHVGLGKYRVSKAIAANAALGAWSITIKWDNTVEPARRYPGGFEVVTAAQADPAAALATTVAQVDTLAGRLTSGRAAKLDQIGSAAAIVTAGSLAAGDRMELRRGNSYLAADGNAKTWAYTGPAIANGTLTLRTFAGVTVLQVPVTQSGSAIMADLSAVQTAALALGTPIYRYEVEATLSGGGTSTLVAGDVWVAD